MIGGGDIHDGRPGDELHKLQADEIGGYELIRRQGTMGVWARDLTRDAARILDVLVAVENIGHRHRLGSHRIPQMDREDRSNRLVDE